MESKHEKRADKPTGNDGEISPNSLESAESYVSRSAGTGGPGDGCGKEFSAAFRALVEWGQTHKLIRCESDFLFFRRAPVVGGNEHEVWFDETSNRWFKATYPGQFGLAWGREGTATPREYLTRLVLHNKYFKDNIQLVALIEWSQRLRVLISQPHIAGEAAQCHEIKEWFICHGFAQLHCNGRIAWYRKRENLLVADAHEGNVIKSKNGELVPIDLNITQPVGKILEWVSNYDFGS
jgi:hypothetical protein